MHILFFFVLLLLSLPSQADNQTPIESTAQEFFENTVNSATRPFRTGEAPLKDGLISTKIGRVNIHMTLVHGLKMSVDDSDFNLNLGGRILLDTAHYFDDKNELGDNGFGIRSIRADLYGQFNKNWQYMFSLGGFTTGGKIDTSGLTIDHLFVRYLGIKNYVITAGQHKEPFSLESLTSRTNLTFMERALNNAFAPGSTVGLSLLTGTKKWTARAGFFGSSIKNEKDQGNQGHGITGNFSGTVFETEEQSLHLGGSYSFHDIENTSDVFFRSRPESGLTDVRYVNTGTITGGKFAHRFGFESLWISGPWSFQGEFMHVLIDRKSGFENLHFNGWYAFLSWFPTGESRNHQQGIIKNVKPLHNYGAVELAVRYSSINLTSADVYGGKEKDLTLGANWYINPYLRIMLNYIYVTTDINANDDNTVIGDDSPHILQARLQWKF